MDAGSSVGSVPPYQGTHKGDAEHTHEHVEEADDMDGDESPTILEEAAEVVGGDRNENYGNPDANHTTTALLFSVYLRRKYDTLPSALSARDVCIFNILQKISRDAEVPTRDNEVDIAGYARNMEIIREGW